MLLSAKEIIKTSLKILKVQKKRLFPYIFLSFLISLLSILFSFTTNILPFLSSFGLSLWVMILVVLFLVLLVIIFSVLLNIALVRLVTKVLKGEPVLPFSEQLKEAKHSIGRTIGISLVVSIIVLLPLLITFIGYSIIAFTQFVLARYAGGATGYIILSVLALYGIFHFIYFFTKYALSYYIVALGEGHIRQSLHQSAQLTHKRMFSVLWRLIAPTFVFMLLYVIFTSLLEGIVALFHSATLVVIICNLLSLFAGAIITLLTLISTVILYHDLKQNTMAAEVPFDAQKS